MDAGINSVPAELVNFIKTGSDFIIAGHKEPDGDCAGSQLALRSALERMGKKAAVYSAGPFTHSGNKNIKSLFSDKIPQKDDTDTRAIIVDCSNLERTGSLQEGLEKYPYAIIDHHATTKYNSSTGMSPVYICADSPSCTILIEKLIVALGLELTKEEAEHLLFGLCTDTGFFRHLTETSAEIFEFASRMIRRGASPKKCFGIMHGGKSFKSRLLIGHILSRTESFFDGKFLLSYETYEDFNAFGLENRDSDSLNQLLLSCENVEAIAVIRQECDDSCTVSLRSADKINVAQIASSFGGGGHKNAAGLTMQGGITDVKKTILNTFSGLF